MKEQLMRRPADRRYDSVARMEEKGAAGRDRGGFEEFFFLSLPVYFVSVRFLRDG
ncbi:MAG: hypothetical protein V8S96_07900 [Lachnospiraceae bacterium]